MTTNPTSPPATTPANDEPILGRAPRRPGRRPIDETAPAPPLPPHTPRPAPRPGPADFSDGSDAASTPSPSTTATTSGSSATSEGGLWTDDLGFVEVDEPRKSPGRRPELNLVDVAEIQANVVEGIRIAGDEANTRFAPPGSDVWIADDRDEEKISAPVARIIARHLPAGADDLGNPDLADAIAAGIAVLLYVRKQIARLRAWRRAVAEADAAEGDEFGEVA